MTVQQLIDVLKANGWRETKTEQSYRRLQHETLRRTVSISGKLELNVTPAALRAIQRYAQLQE